MIVMSRTFSEPKMRCRISGFSGISGFGKAEFFPKFNANSANIWQKHRVARTEDRFLFFLRKDVMGAR